MAGFLSELKRRNVIRVAIAYIVVAWLLLQVVDIVVPILSLPEWVDKFVLLLIGIGLPVALLFAWAYELTPEGLKREKDIPPGASITHRTGRQLDKAIIGALVVALGVSLFVNFSGSLDREPDNTSAAIESSHSIAVLPFVNRSANQADAYFVDGIHDELLTQLTKIGSLKVISRTSVMGYRDTTKKIPVIADELGVAHILEGGVQRSGDQIRIFAQLIKADTDQHLWAETYDRELTVDNLLDIQSEIARNIASALRATLSPQEERQLNQQMTSDLRAYEAFLRARVGLNTLDPDHRQKAIDELRFALERDPQFAAAWASLATAYLRMYWFVDPDPALRDLAWEAIARGREIDSDLVGLDIAEGYYHYWGFRNYDKALQAMERAIEVASGDTEVLSLVAFINRRLGNFDAFFSASQKVLELDPRQPGTFFSIAETHTLINNWQEAAESLRAGLLMDPTSVYGNNIQSKLLIEKKRDFESALDLFDRHGSFDVIYEFVGWWIENVRENYVSALGYADFDEFTETKFSILPPERQRGLTYLYSGNAAAAKRELDASRVWLETWRDQHPGDPRAYRSLCVVYGGLGMVENAEAACDKSVEALPNDVFAAGYLRVEIAKGLALAGLDEQALDMIELYLEKPSGFGPVRTEFEPAFRTLRRHPRFQKAVADAGGNG
ncbi:MAG: hypothetical protein O6931_03360 [Gammaproteobacteria bacterium]|nr:hypothetical protein [Gammaproteobacteria bacterium]